MNKQSARKWFSLLLAGWLLVSPAVMTAHAVPAEPELGNIVKISHRLQHASLSENNAMNKRQRPLSE